MREISMPRVRVGHIALAYDAEGSGTPVVLIHGFTLDRTLWDEQTAALLAAGYRVIRPDLRGHGASDAPPTGYTAEDHAADLATLFDVLGVPSAHIVGLSLGGGVGACFAERWPRRTRSLTLIDAILPGRPFGEELTGILRELNRRVLAGDLKGALHEHWATSRLFHPTRDNPALAARLYAMNERFSGVQFHDRVAPPAGPSVADRLSEVKAPALALVGELDLSDFHTFARAYAEELPDARLQTIPAAGHLASLDNPAAVNAALIDFLRDVDAEN
jgi:3-oxoadipate enol-lactonase